MSIRLLETLSVVLATVFLFAGCEKSIMSDESEVSSGLDPVNAPTPTGFAAEAFDATGGLEAWTATKRMRLDCVVTSYEPDGSFYLTEQRCDVQPWSNAIDISGCEPNNEFTWRFSNGQFTVLQGAGQIDQFPADLESACFARAILAIATAPFHFLESPDLFNRQDAAVRKQGQWYYPIHKIGDVSGKIVFYQNRETRLIDMIRIPCPGMNTALAVRGYDYGRIKKEGPLVPARIEIFTMNVAGILQKRLVKIDCHNIGQVE
ncbi:MAG: hypothetical protein JXM79_21970 [Sedimentisphaerales bacterium]|nr:hypothetical protein [Sedimentisphaerales bacterium]